MKKQTFISLIFCIGFLFLTTLTEAAVKIWTNSSGDFNWTTAINWSGNTVPVSGDDLVFNNGGPPYTITFATFGYYYSGDVLIDNNTDVTLTSFTNNQIKIWGNLTINTSTCSLTTTTALGIQLTGNLICNGLLNVQNYFELQLNAYRSWTGSGSVILSNTEFYVNYYVNPVATIDIPIIVKGNFEINGLIPSTKCIEFYKDFTVTGNATFSEHGAKFLGGSLNLNTNYNTNFSTTTVGSNAQTFYLTLGNLLTGATFGNLTLKTWSTLTINMSNSNIYVYGNLNLSTIGFPPTLDIQGPNINFYLNGNFFNYGNFIAGTSTFIFKGSWMQPQTLNGFTTTFNNLTINNGSWDAVTLNTKAIVNNNLLLINGRVNTSSMNLLIMNISSQVNGASNISYANGPVAKIGNTNFTFPVGKDYLHYRPMAVSNISAIDTLTAEYFHVNPHLSGYNVYSLENPPLDHVSNCEYWNLQSSATVSANVTLSWDTLGAGYSCGVTSGYEGNLRVASWDSPLSKWMNNGNILFSVPARTVTSSTVSKFNRPFTLSSITENNPLPIELLSFDAKYNGETVDVYWSTASEINNHFFDVEKSLDGNAFTHLARIDGASNSTTKINYHIVDDKILKGISYYRLIQTDYDGKSSIYGPVAIRIELKEINVYPVASSMSVFLINGELNDAKITVYTIDGKQVVPEITVIDDNNINVALVGKSPGLYFISIQSKDELKTAKVLIL